MEARILFVILLIPLLAQIVFDVFSWRKERKEAGAEMAAVDVYRVLMETVAAHD